VKYLLDTCVLSDFARGDANTLARVKSTPPQLVAVSSVTVMEVEFGLALNAARARKLAPVMHALLGSMTVLPYHSEDARATATLRAVLQKRGRPIGPYDALIAGCALSRGLVLVTSNESEFQRVSGLAVENWRSGRR
jgi:tRNA(fMet)-specific endonuclease VapC